MAGEGSATPVRAMPEPEARSDGVALAAGGMNCSSAWHAKTSRNASAQTAVSHNADARGVVSRARPAQF